MHPSSRQRWVAHCRISLTVSQFLGHGWCETFNKSSSIGNKGGSPTDDPLILGAESVKLLRAMKLDPLELRGVGIQITKLDAETKAAEREAGQGTLRFSAKKGPQAVSVEPVLLEPTRTQSVWPVQGVQHETNLKIPGAEAKEAVVLAEAPDSPHAHELADLSEPEIPRRNLTVTCFPAQETVVSRSTLTPNRRVTRSASDGPVSDQVAEAGPSRVVTSSDGIDPDFLAALPLELRLEVKRDYARTRATSEKPPVPAPPFKEPRAATISPAKPKGMHVAAHITKQLRPKLKTQLKASAVADLPLYGAWTKAKDREQAVDLTADVDDKIGIFTVSELRELDIDPEVFVELPSEMQMEVVNEERRKHRQRKVLYRPADRSRFRSKDRESTRTASRSPTRSSRVGSVPPKPVHRIAVTRASKPVLLKAILLPDVLDTVSRWIESRGSSGPARRDAEKVKTYLVKCMAPDAGFGGLENAIEVLKWMRSVLLERWEEDEKEMTDAGREWWATWWGFKKEVDRVSAQRFGAPIRL